VELGPGIARSATTPKWLLAHTPSTGLSKRRSQAGDLERGTMVAAADHYVVDPAAKLQRPVVAAAHQRVARRERVTGNPRVGALPSVPVADARITQGLQPAPVAHASRVAGSIEVASQDHVAYLTLAQQIL
jgi:hypothetical protein